MRKVNVRTAQNVIIDFQVSSLSQRGMAYVLDMIIILGSVLLINITMALIVPELSYLQYFIIAFYTPVSEIFMNGQTLGKKALKIRVINVKGKEPVTLDYIIRWAFRFIDLYLSFFSVAVILSSTSTRGQRLGGLLSNTMVVSLKGEMNLNLTDILKIEDRTNYEPKYEQAYRFTEDEMMTVKTLLERYRKFRNTAHAALVNEAAERCSMVLELPTAPSDKIDFLKTVLRDYIVITRS